MPPGDQFCSECGAGSSGALRAPNTSTTAIAPTAIAPTAITNSVPPSLDNPAPGTAYAPPPSGYPQPVPAYAVPTVTYIQTAGTNGMAVASMVLGILWLYWFGSLLALIFGYVALSQLKQRQQSGRGMAIAGIVLGWIGAATLVLFIIIAAAVSHSTNP
jgi:hypothetical protein